MASALGWRSAKLERHQWTAPQTRSDVIEIMARARTMNKRGCLVLNLPIDDLSFETARAALSAPLLAPCFSTGLIAACPSLFSFILLSRASGQGERSILLLNSSS